MKRLKKNRKGFSLIELLIVIAIIGIIATIAIPILLSARQGAIREKARNTCRTIVSAQAAYYAANGTYAPLATLAAPAAPQTPYVDTALGASNIGPEFAISVITAADETGFEYEVATLSTNIPDYRCDETGLVTEIP